MDKEREKQAKLILQTLIGLLKEFEFSMDVYKDGTLAFTDLKNGKRYKAEIKDEKGE